MSNIPMFREIILEICDEIADLGHPEVARKIDDAVMRHLFRHSTKPRSRVKSRAMTSGLAAIIRNIHQREPGLSAQEIADMVNVNPGRVSEAIAGKW